MPATNVHGKWVNGNFVLYDTHRARWVDAYGPNVFKWELPTNHAAGAGSSGGLTQYNVVVTSSSNASAYVTGGTAGKRLKFSTMDSNAKYAMCQAKTFPFKLENSMPLYFGCKVQLNSATSTDFVAGLLVNKSGTILASHDIASSIDGVYFLKKDTATTLTPTTASSSGGSVSTTSTKTMANTTDYILEFYWNGSASSGAIDFYASGALLGTVTSNIDQTATLGVSFGLGCGKSAHNTLSVTWARVIQLRT